MLICGGSVSLRSSFRYGIVNFYGVCYAELQSVSSIYFTNFMFKFWIDIIGLFVYMLCVRWKCVQVFVSKCTNLIFHLFDF